MRLTDTEIQELKERTDLVALARELGANLRQSGGKFVGKFVGSCPVCGGGKSAQRFEVKGQAWVCAVCCDGGDAMRLVQNVTGVDFRGAVERLGGPRALSEEETAALARRRLEAERARTAEAERYRAAELARLKRLWEGSEPHAGGLHTYFAARGTSMPVSADLRLLGDCPYFHGYTLDEAGRRSPRVIHRGPAMLAGLRDGENGLVGLHITWLAPDCAGKATIADPDSGAVLPSKKMRGSKAGARIVVRTGGDAPTRLFMGEGIETVASVGSALHAARQLRAGDALWAAGDLGNMGGPHADTVTHPTLKGPKGGALRAPGPQPDMARPGIVIPPSVTTLVLLGDGDSDPVVTHAALERGRRRYARPGMAVAIAMAPDGRDFNNLIVGD